MAEFSQLALEASVPTEVMQLLPDFEVATFARSCTSHTEAEEMISQLCADSGLGRDLQQTTGQGITTAST